MSARRPLKAYENQSFLNSKDGRLLRLLAEYVEPKSRFDRHQVKDTIVFMGSARIRPAQAETTVPGTSDANAELAGYYDAARELARRLTLWSKGLDPVHGRFVVCTGGGPGIMEAANRGAADVQGINVGLTISIPVEEFENPFITHDLAFSFHYFFMRKFWFAYLAKAVIVFPGGFGTLDELFELLTLVQTRKMRKPMPIVLFGERYWRDVINFDALVRYGTISPVDVELFFKTDSVDETYDLITRELMHNHALARPGPTL
jgi:uncharacterized protein (TIGR00730 family)